MHNVRILKSLLLLPLILMLSVTEAFAKPDEPVADAAIRTLAPTARQASLDQTIAELSLIHI